MTRHERGAAPSLSGRGGAARVTALTLALLAAGPAGAEGEKLTVSRAGAVQYGPDAALACAAGGVTEALQGELAGIAKASGKPAAVPDGRLCAAAEALQSWKRQGPPPESALTFLSWRFGLPSPIPRRGVLTATIEGEDWRDIGERFAEAAKPFLATAAQPRFGVSTRRLREGGARTGVTKTRVVLVLVDSPLDLQPVPRQLPAGGQAALSGRVLGDLKNPKVYVCAPDGTFDAPAQTGDALKADLRCGAKPGRLLVDVRAERAGEALSVGRLEILCGVAPADAVDAPAPQKGAVDVAAAEKRLLDLSNAERTAAGLPALAPDPAVGAVARGAAEAYRAQAQGGAAPAFDVQGRLRQLEVSTLNVLQNPVAALSVDEAAAVTAQSAVNRCNLLSREVNTVGVGVAPLADASGNSVIYATTLLVRELPPVDAAAVRAKLREAVAQRRAAAGAPALKADPVLEEVAQKYADLLATSKGSPAKADESAVVAPLYKSFSKVDVMSGAKADALEMAQEPGVVGPAHGVGVGVAVGANAVLGKNAPYAVVILGTPHAPGKGAPAHGKKR